MTDENVKRCERCGAELQQVDNGPGCGAFWVPKFSSKSITLKVWGCKYRCDADVPLSERIE